VQTLTEDELYTFARLMTMSAADYLDEWFETDVVKASLCSSGIIGTLLGPRSPGTAYVLMHHYMGEIDGAYRSWGYVRGGMGMVSESIARAARLFGAEIRVNAEVRRILVQDGRAIGVELASGEKLYAKVIASGADPKRTFLKMIERSDLPADFVRGIENFKIEGSSGKVNLALKEAPSFSCLPGNGVHLQGAISIGPSVDYIEKAYDDAKYGDYSHRPYVDMCVPSTLDPTLAPPGKHLMSCFIQYAPYTLRKGTWEERREAFGETVLDTLEEYIPNLRKIILHRQVLSPWDLEQMIGLTGGNIFHGELTPDQLLFLRPTPGARARETCRGWRPRRDGGDCPRFPRLHRSVRVRHTTAGSRQGSEPGRARGPIHPAGPRRRCVGRRPGPPHLEGCPEDRESPRFGLGERRAGVSAIHRIPEPIRGGARSDPRHDAAQSPFAELGGRRVAVPPRAPAAASRQASDAADASPPSDVDPRFPERVVRDGAVEGELRGRRADRNLRGAILPRHRLRPGPPIPA